MDANPTLYASFVAELAAPIAAQLAGDEAGARAALAVQWDAAQAAWPDVAVTPDRFAAELARRIGSRRSGAETLAAVAATRGSDVYLAIACCDGNEPAIGRFDEMIARELRQVGLRLRASPDQTAELQAELRRLLLIDDGERSAALREYAGRGDLRSYLRVMATRAMIRAINRGRREVAIDDGEFFDRMLPHDDPELGFLREHYREAVDLALRAALAGLDARSRALLRYQLIDGWSIDQVGKLYGVHRATAARWLSDAREGLGQIIRGELAARLKVATEEVDSIVRLVQSRVDMSLDRLLVPEGLE